MGTLWSHPSPPSTNTSSTVEETIFLTLSELEVFRGRQRLTLFISLTKVLVRASGHLNFSQKYGIQQFQSLQDLDRLIELGHDRQLLKHLCKEIFGAAQRSPDHKVREHYYHYCYLYQHTVIALYCHVAQNFCVT